MGDFGETFQEFADEWPKQSQRPLASLSRLLSQFGLEKAGLEESEEEE